MDSSRLRRLDEHLVVLALDLEVGTAGRRHRDRLVKFKHCQMVQGRGNMETF